MLTWGTSLLAHNSSCASVGGTRTDWRSSLRVFEQHGHPKLKDWIEEQCKAPDAGSHVWD